MSQGWRDLQSRHVTILLSDGDTLSAERTHGRTELNLSGRLRKARKTKQGSCVIKRESWSSTKKQHSFFGVREDIINYRNAAVSQNKCSRER